jgi:peroxiredoxin
MQQKIKENVSAPDFELVDTLGRTIRLADYRGKKIVVLVLMRGFM